MFHKDAEVRLKKLMVSEEKLEAQIAALKARLKSERASCIKGWTDLTKEYREWQKSLSGGEAKKIEKLEKNFVAKREKLRAAFLKFEQLVDAGNAEQKAYWTKELPAIVSNYEFLEVERCNELEVRLQDFRTIQSEYSQPFPGMLAMVDLAVKAINGPKELKGFVDQVVAANGRPEPPLNFVDGLPADSRALLEHANQSTLGALLNQEPLALAAQREAMQLKTSGNVMGLVSAISNASVGSPPASGTLSRRTSLANLNSAASSSSASPPPPPPAPAAPASQPQPHTPLAAATAAYPRPPSGPPPPPLGDSSSSSSSTPSGGPATRPYPPLGPPPPLGATAAAAAFSVAAAFPSPAAASSSSSSSPAFSSSSAPTGPPPPPTPTLSSSSFYAASSSSSSSAAAAAVSATDPFNRAADPPATYVRALYDFTSEDADDLTFTLNTVIRVTLKGEDDELAAEAEEADPSAEPRWWRGQRLENIGKSRDGTFPSNYVKVCGVERDMSLRHLLEIPSGLRVFSEFLAGEYATENIQFWCAVESFRERCMAFLNDSGEIQEAGRAVTLAEAESISKEFIGGSAASQVNISSSTLKLTQDRIASLPASLSLNMFDEAGQNQTNNNTAAQRARRALGLGLIAPCLTFLSLCLGVCRLFSFRDHEDVERGFFLPLQAPRAVRQIHRLGVHAIGVSLSRPWSEGLATPRRALAPSALRLLPQSASSSAVLPPSPPPRPAPAALYTSFPFPPCVVYLFPLTRRLLSFFSSLSEDGSVAPGNRSQSSQLAREHEATCACEREGGGRKGEERAEGGRVARIAPSHAPRKRTMSRGAGQGGGDTGDGCSHSGPLPWSCAD